jgi:hypothetical protein
MNDNLSISSPQTPTYPPSIQDGHRQGDVSTDEGLQSTTSVQTTPLLTTEATVPASLKESYTGSTAQLEEPSLNINQQDITELSLLAQSLTESSSASETATSAANTSAASQILEIIDLYLQFEKDKDDEYYNPGAPNAEETTNYQQELESSSQSQIPSHVASTALSTRQTVSSMNSGLHPQRGEMGVTAEETGSPGTNTNKPEQLLIHHVHSTTREEGSRLGQIAKLLKPGVDLRNIGRNNHPLTHHENPVTGTRGNVIGRDSRHNVMRKGLGLDAIYNKKDPTSEPSQSISTATYSNEESLNDLRKNLFSIGRSNNLSSINEIKKQTTEELNEEAKIMLSRDADLAFSVQKSIKTLAGVTNKPRPQALNV